MIRFYNGVLLAMADGCAVTRDEVWTDGDRITYVGPERVDAPPFEREIDLRGDLLMPGFKDAHTHSAMTFLRSYADDLPLQSWLFDKVFPLEEKLTPEAIYAFTKLAILEYLSNGITASFDMYFHLDDYVSANLESGFRTVICAVAGSSSTPDFKTIEENYGRFNSMGPLVGYRLGFHAEYTSKPEVLRDLAALARQYKAPVWTHISETKSEVEGCRERHGGMTPAEYFDSLGLYDFGGGGYHCVWFTERDIEIFRRRGLWAVSCPASNAKLASGIAPLTELMDAGVGLALGTDGAASNNALDMFREMYLACVLQKLRRSDAAACGADRILEAATVGGARAMGLTDCDCIAPGKAADMIVIDMSRPNMQPEHNIDKNLVYSGSGANVRLTMIGGRVLYENGEYHIGEDAQRICERAAARTKEIVESV